MSVTDIRFACIHLPSSVQLSVYISKENEPNRVYCFYKGISYSFMVKLNIGPKVSMGAII